jgi:tetratricopeptide (TPR) repeat protein
MALNRPFKSLLVALSRQVKGKSQKEVAAASDLTVSHLGDIERGTTKNPANSDIILALDGMECKPAETIILSACLEALDQLDPLEDPGEAAAREEVAAAAAERVRRRLRTPEGLAPSSYPAPYEVALDQEAARESWQTLKAVESLEDLVLVVRVAREYQTWAMVQWLCDESIHAASKDAGRAMDLALLAVLLAGDLRVMADWRRFLIGYAAAHLANAYRVAGDHGEAEWALEAAKRLWAAGRDPDQLLDPGRLFDLEASLRRDQRRFADSLSLLEQAAPITRRPEHVSLQIAFTLEVMGEYEQAIDALLEVAPRVENHPEPRLKTIQRFNLAVSLTHVGRHREAARLLPSIRQLAEDLQDDLDCVRARWLEGRVAAGLGHTEEALEALEEARHDFATRDMHYDVVLSLVETSALRLELGDYVEVQRLAGELAPIFAQNGVHAEAQKALRIFEEAVTRQKATAGLARRLLSYLFRARHDSGLQFA